MSQQKQQHKTIETEIAVMLKENTGASFLDSGGAYGRNWEHNQKIEDFSQQPIMTVEYSKAGYNTISLSLYHLLTQTLSITKESDKLDKALQRFMNKKEYEESGYLEIAEEFNEKYLQPRGMNIERFDNTYNHDSILSQDFQFGLITKEGEEYPDFILIQIHGGCDIRGGYTAPRIFAFADFENFVTAQSDIEAGCKCTGVYSDDCGYHWYIDREPEPEHENIDKLLNVEGKIEAKEEIEKYKLPSYWKITDNEESMICSKCKDTVNFGARIY